MKLKRTFSLVIALAMAISNLSVSYADEMTEKGLFEITPSDDVVSDSAIVTDDVDDLKAYGNTPYKVSGGNIYFDPETGSITDADSSISVANIPSSIGGVAVTAIDNRAFWNCKRLSNVTIPNSVTFIGSYAFSDCISLYDIVVPDSVTIIDSYAFYGCSNLTNVKLPDSVTTLGNYAFDGCSSLTNINIPNKIKLIDWGTFSGCSSLTSIKIPASVTKIDVAAFENCGRLKTVEFVTGSAYIECAITAFYGCSNIKDVIIPDTVTYIDRNLFYSCNKNELVIHTKKGSYVASWALENGWNVSYDYSELTTTTEKTTQPTTQATTETTTSIHYKIENADQLYEFAEKVNNAGGEIPFEAELMCDIVVNENVLDRNGNLNSSVGLRKWEPIGNSTENSFHYGTFNGNGHKISGLYFDNSNRDNVGLFGVTISSVIEGVILTDSYIRGNSQVGGICGISGISLISDCYNESTIKGSQFIGGICGLDSTTYGILNCGNSGIIGNSSSKIVGGICGSFSGYDSTSLPAETEDYTCIAFCSNDGTIYGDMDIGGICGANSGQIRNSYNEGFVKGGSTGIAGICGSNGNDHESGEILYCYNTGDATSMFSTGGICSVNKGSIKYCYSIGNINADYAYGIQGKAGGICGENYSNIIGCYSNIDPIGAGNHNGASEVSLSEFESGEVCYKLNNNSNTFKQTLGIDTYPNFTGKVVLYDSTSNKYYNTDAIKGDVNGDGKINRVDFNIVNKYFSGWSMDIDDYTWDVNGDKTISRVDYNTFIKYFSGWNITLG